MSFEPPKRSPSALRIDKQEVFEKDFERIHVEEPVENVYGHIWRRTKEHKAITLGFLATCGAMAMMIRHRHDPKKLNVMGRWRLGFQGVTVGALLYSMYQDERRHQQSPLVWEWDFSNRFKRTA